MSTINLPEAPELMKAVAAEIGRPGSRNQAEVRLFEKLQSLSLDLSKEFGPESNILFHRGVAFMRKGNLSVVQGKPKSGKSFLCSMIAAAAVSGRYESLTGHRETPLERVLYFDTEQSEEDSTRVARRVLQMSRLPTGEFPANFEMYSLRREAPEDARELVSLALRTYRPALAVVDGVTDLLVSPNDEAESKRIVSWLYNLAEECGAHVMVVIHENVGTAEKARGHIGSELLRKCETSIRLKREKKEGVTHVLFNETRRAPAEDFLFTIDAEGIPHMGIAAPDGSVRDASEASGPASRDDVDRATLLPLFADGETYTYTELKREIMDKLNLSEGGAKSLLKRAKDNVIFSDNGRYSLPLNPFSDPIEGEDEVPF